MNTRNNYPRTTLFNANSVSDGLGAGASESFIGYGDDVFVTLSNVDGASVVMQQRRAYVDGAQWANIGATTTQSAVVFRMSMQSSMEYQFVITVPSATAVAVTMRESIPTAIQDYPVLVNQIRYSDGFPEYDNSTSDFIQSLNKTDLIFRWTAARASETFWNTNEFVLGSNGLLYYLNPDRGNGVPGNQTVDPVSGDGTTSASWVAITSLGTNFVTDKIAEAAPLTTDALPTDLPTDSTNGVNMTLVRYYDDAIITYYRDSSGWIEKARWEAPAGSLTTGISSADATVLINAAIAAKDDDKYIGTRNASLNSFPAANKNEWVIFVGSATVNTKIVESGQAWRCTADNSEVSDGTNWVLDEARTLIAHGRGTNAERLAALDSKWSWFVSEPGPNYGQWFRPRLGTWYKAYGDERFIEEKQSLTHTAAALHPVHYRGLRNLRYPSMVDTFPEGLTDGYVATFKIPAYVDGNSHQFIVGDGTVEQVVDKDDTPGSDGSATAYAAGIVEYTKDGNVWRQTRRELFPVAASTTPLTP